MTNPDKMRTITYGETTLTRTSTGGASGYGWRSPKWRCDTCDKRGLGDMLIPGRWAETCARGHAPCPWCGRMCPVLHDGAPRVHTGCKSRPDDVNDKWDAAKGLLIEVRTELVTGQS
jgi:hypothetical protein